MNDRELLELAAKAAEYTDLTKDMEGFARVLGEHEDGQLCLVRWNPLTDDGDALRLAVKLQIIFAKYDHYANAGKLGEKADFVVWDHEEKNPYAATRRAITRAAAEIGRAM